MTKCSIATRLALTPTERRTVELGRFGGWTDKGVNAKARSIRRRLKRCGVTVKRYPVGGRTALVAEQGDPTSGPVLVLHAHPDTVYVGDSGTPRVDDEFIWGNGAADNNVGVALLERIAVAKLPGARRVVFGPWEETYPALVPRLLGEQRYPNGWGDFAITLEPSGLNVVTDARGALGIALKFEGRSGHDAHTEPDQNPAERMLRTWSALKALPFMRERSPHYDDGPRANTTRVWSQGGAVNQTCDACGQHIMIRTLPGQDHREIVEAIRRLPGAPDVEVEADLAPVGVSGDHRAVQELCGLAQSRLVSARGGSDIGGFGIPGVEFGPLGYDLHSPSERLARASIEPCYTALESFCRWFATSYA